MLLRVGGKIGYFSLCVCLFRLMPSFACAGKRSVSTIGWCRLTNSVKEAD